MRVNVIRAFPLARDGLTTAMIETGEQDVPDHLVEGLIGDGYICGDGHAPVALSAARRSAIIDSLLASMEAHLEAASDSDLLEGLRRLEEMKKAEAFAPAAVQPAADPTGDPSPPLEHVPAIEPTDTELKAQYKTKTGHNPPRTWSRDQILAALKE